ncbi:MAG TPA: DUF4175 family protein [Ignavibacteriaceae bacterium]|nr:DUF4175 family protein [Ignavibacteriaceae bacterium]
MWGIILYSTFSILEALFHFDSDVRTVLFFLSLIFTLGAVSILFVIPLLKYFNIFRKTDYYTVSEKAGRNFPLIKDDLLNAMQLVSTDREKNYSSNLINAAFLDVYNKTKNIQFEKIVDFKKATELFKYLAGTIMICALLFIFIPSLQAASFRLANFGKEFIPPPRFTFVIEPGNTQATKGDNLSISVKVNGEVPKNVSLGTKDAEQTKYEMQDLKRDSSGVYGFQVKSVRSSFKYFASADGINSQQYNVSVIDPPIIKTLDVDINSPSYSGIPAVNQKDNGNVSALKGSRVSLKISSTKNLKYARLVFSDSTEVTLKTNGEEARGSFRIKNDNYYRIIIRDNNDNENISPINYTIKALDDAYPVIEVIAPNENLLLPNDNRIALLTKISDDYGFTKLNLAYRLSASKYKENWTDYKTLEIPLNRKLTEQNVSYIWNLSQLHLSENDVVTYYLEIFDNDNVSGPKSAKTASFTVRVPTLNELITQADKTQNKAINDLQQTLKDAEDLKKNIEKISQELKQDKKDISWQEKEKIEKSLEHFKKMQDKSDQISKKIDDLKKNLQQNNLMSQETLEKYSELQKLFDTLSSDGMKKMAENMQNLLQSLDRKQIQQAMENFKFDEEQFRASIERTMNLLKRIQAEQKVNDLVNKMDEIIKKQENIEQETKRSNLNDKNKQDELSSGQNEITKEMNDLKEQMDDLSKKMSELKDQPKEDLDKLQEEFNQQENSELSKEASQKIQQSQKQMAMQNQKQIQQNMKHMKGGMQDLQKTMRQKIQMQTFVDMMKLTDNLISLSKQQEVLRKESGNLDPTSSAFKSNSEQQNNIQKNLDKIATQMSELSQKTFAITPEMGKALGDAKRAMMRSLDAMQNRNGNQALSNQGEAMKGLNEAASLMKNSMQQMMNGQGQGGMMSLMQQLGQMTQQQMNLNNLTQMLQQAMGGKLTMQQQAQLDRLAQQQEEVRKTLKQLSEEAKASGKSKTLASNLDKLLDQMQEVVTNMKTQKINDDLIQKQEKILSKMLDAQRSVNERDYEKDRESFAGENIQRQSPANLDLNSEQGKNKIRDELNRAVQEGYSKDYEELIRKYYEALQKVRTEKK